MISVIIPVGYNEPHIYNRISEIEHTIGCEHEIIVVTIDPDVCKKVDVRCVYSWANPAEARNIGAMMASYDILVFTDAHTEFKYTKYGWGEILASVIYGNVGVVTFPRYILYGDINNPERWINTRAKGLKFNDDINLLDVKYIEPIDEEIPFIWGDFHAIRKEVFLKLGCYITEGWGHFEDRTLCVTSTLFGYRNLCIEDAVIGAYIRPPGSKPTFPYWWYGNIAFGALHYTSERYDRFRSYWGKDFDVVADRWKHMRSYYMENRIHDDNWYFNEFLNRYK